MPKKPLHTVYAVERRGTLLGAVLYVQVSRQDGKKMGFRALWEAVTNEYPGKWAVQIFPPRGRLVDERNLYHLWILDDPIAGNFDISRRTT